MQTQQLPTTEAPVPTPPAPAPATPAAYSPDYPPDWRELRRQERLARRARWHEAGVPVWGVLLVAIGTIVLLGNLGLNFGWLFGLALGTWFVYLGARPALLAPPPEVACEPINWWLVGLGLLIGLGSISTGFADALVFPAVLIIVGLGIIGQQAWTRQRPPQ